MLRAGCVCIKREFLVCICRFVVVLRVSCAPMPHVSLLSGRWIADANLPSRFCPRSLPATLRLLPSLSRQPRHSPSHLGICSQHLLPQHCSVREGAPQSACPQPFAPPSRTIHKGTIQLHSSMPQVFVAARSVRVGTRRQTDSSAVKESSSKALAAFRMLALCTFFSRHASGPKRGKCPLWATTLLPSQAASS